MGECRKKKTKDLPREHGFFFSGYPFFELIYCKWSDRANPVDGELEWSFVL